MTSATRRRDGTRVALIPAGAIGLPLAALVLGLVGAPRAAGAPVPVPTASTSTFAVLAGSTVTNTGASLLTGNLGLSPGSAVTGFPPGAVSGTQDVANAPAAQAQADLGAAYDNAAGQGPSSPVTTDLGGMTLTAGVYNAPASVALTGTLTLNGANDPNAVFVIQAGSTLTTAAASQIHLINGAQACNVFWQVGSSATLGASSGFSGTILALTSVTVGAGVTVDGGVLARNGSVTLDADTITAPTCATPAVAPSTAVPSRVPVALSAPVPARISAADARAIAAKAVAATRSVSARLRALEVSAAKTSTPVTEVIANQATVMGFGGSVVVHAVTKGAKTCRWTSTPTVKAFDGPVACAALLSRTALVQQNQLTTARKLTLSLVTTGVGGARIGKAVVVESQTQFTQFANWSGYILPSRNKFTAVSDAWTVPTMNCIDARDAIVTTFVGTGGVHVRQGQSSGPLLQTGIDSSCNDGLQQESAWWEEVPLRGNYVVNFTGFAVSPGDAIVGSVFRNSQGNWQTELDDTNTGMSAISVIGGDWQVFATATLTPIGPAEGTSIGLTYPGARSAEWIVEDPEQAGSMLAFANAGSEGFTSLLTSRLHWSLLAVDGAEMVQSGRTLSMPSAPGNRTFSVINTTEAA